MTNQNAVVESNPNGFILKTTPIPKAQRTLREKKGEDCESQMTRELAVRVSL